MTPTQILAIVKDVAIIAGLIFVIFWIRNDGKNVVKLQDIQAVQKQIASNAQQEAAWASQRQAAEIQHANDLTSITAAVGAHSAPIIVRIPASPSSVSGNSPQTSSPDTSGRTIDIRAGVTAFELKYEQVLADCREAVNLP